MDLHGPHDHQSLLSRDRQRAMLDAFAGAGAALAAHSEAHAAWRASLSALLGEFQGWLDTQGARLRWVVGVEHVSAPR